MKYMIAFFSVICSFSSIGLAAPINKTLSKSKSRSITIVNDINPKSLKKNYGIFSFNPTSFCVLVDGHPLPAGTRCYVPIQNNKLKIEYHYSFIRGYSGKKAILFTLEPGHTKYHVTFSWEDPFRIGLSHAYALKKIDLEK